MVSIDACFVVVRQRKMCRWGDATQISFWRFLKVLLLYHQQFWDEVINLGSAWNLKALVPATSYASRVFAQVWISASTISKPTIAHVLNTIGDYDRWVLNRVGAIVDECVFQTKWHRSKETMTGVTMFTTKASCRVLRQECLLWNSQEVFCGVMEEKDCNSFIERRCAKECLLLLRQALTNLMCRYETGKSVVTSGEAAKYVVCNQILFVAIQTPLIWVKISKCRPIDLWITRKCDARA